jgi:hypothetical protein
MGSIRQKLEADLAEADAAVSDAQRRVEAASEALRLAVEHKDYVRGLLTELGTSAGAKRATSVPNFRERVIAALGEPGRLSDIGTVLATLEGQGLEVTHQRVRTALGRLVKDGVVDRASRGLYSVSRTA